MPVAKKAPAEMNRALYSFENFTTRENATIHSANVVEWSF